MSMRRVILVALLGALLSFVAMTAGAQDASKDIRTDLGAPPVQPLLPLVSEYMGGAIYEKWWKEIAECEELPLPPEHFRVRFFAVNGVRFADLRRPQFGYDTTNKMIVVVWALASSYLDEGSIYVSYTLRYDPVAIKHEMLHYLMQWAGEPAGHPPRRFERCGVTTSYRAR